MGTKPEATIERLHIEDLEKHGYKYNSSIKSEKDLIDNFISKTRMINKLRGIDISEQEAQRFYMEQIDLLRQTSYKTFEAAKNLHQKIVFKLDNGKDVYLKLISENTSENIYECANQITIECENGETRRFDVMLMINGLPIVHTELKRNSIEISQAKVQIEKYRSENYRRLFNFVQILVCSNGNRTIYAAHVDPAANQETSFGDWMDETNDPYEMQSLTKFTSAFLNKEFLTKYIIEYSITLKEEHLIYMLRPYQVYAIEKTIKRIDANEGGYIWHTTGAGKTLTSWKLIDYVSKYRPQFEKILYVPDAIDLDVQTRKEYKKFDAYIDIDMSKTRTKDLINELSKNGKKVSIVTVQTLCSAIRRYGNGQDQEMLEEARNKKTLIVVDEAHRSWTGTQKNIIKKFFNNAIYIGFTGTPRFAGKNVSKDEVSTEEVFGKCIHAYTIGAAIRDKNVLGFEVEIIDTKIDAKDNESEADRNKLLKSQKRINAVADNIAANIKKNTVNGTCSALLAVSSINELKKYRKAFEKNHPNLMAAYIFNLSERFNMEDDTASPEEIKEYNKVLPEIINDYNVRFKATVPCFENSKSFETYRNDIVRRLKRFNKYDTPIELLVVVSMFTTGFDCRQISCVYIDKHLEYNGLIQTMSRANRPYIGKVNAKIVAFRDLMPEIDSAIALFSNGESCKDAVIRTYQTYIDAYKRGAERMKSICKDPVDVLKLVKTEDIKEFIEAYKETNIAKTRAESFENFNEEDLKKYLSIEDFESYTGFYIELKTKVESNENNLFDPEEFNFELEAQKTVIVNYEYIIRLLQAVKTAEEINDIIKTINDSNMLISKKKDIVKAISEINVNDITEEKTADVLMAENLNNIEKIKIEEFSKEVNIPAEIVNDFANKIKYGIKVKGYDVITALNEKGLTEDKGNKTKKILEFIKAL